MLKKIFGKRFAASGGNDRLPANAPGSAPDLARIASLVEFFPIGKKLRYYPEFKQDIILDTLVVAYCVNGLYVYASEAIERDDEGRLLSFRAVDSGVRVGLAEIRSFQLLVPNTSHLESKLDYHRRAQIGRGKQFNKGNYISLISNAGAQGVSTVDTEVATQVVLADGPYARTAMVLLTPELHTLKIADQRRKSRARLSVPVILHVPEDRQPKACTLVDMSDDDVRLRVRTAGATMPAFRRGDGAMLELDLGVSERHCMIKGAVIRRTAEMCVLRLEGQVCDGRYQTFDPLDLIELKAGLINYGH